MSKKCSIIFRNEDSIQDTIINCELSDNGDLDFKVNFDPPVMENTDLGLAGQMVTAFCKFLTGE